MILPNQIKQSCHVQSARRDHKGRIILCGKKKEGHTMLQFDAIFKPEYQFALKKIDYNVIGALTQPASTQMHLSDTVSYVHCENGIEFNVCRRVYFDPVPVYDLSVTFSVTLTFNDEVNQDEFRDINWHMAFLESGEKQFSIIMPRMSHLIAEITSSYGFSPIITPPRILGETTPHN